jgi:hypothetical protein
MSSFSWQHTGICASVGAVAESYKQVNTQLPSSFRLQLPPFEFSKYTMHGIRSSTACRWSQMSLAILSCHLYKSDRCQYDTLLAISHACSNTDLNLFFSGECVYIQVFIWMASVYACTLLSDDVWANFFGRFCSCFTVNSLACAFDSFLHTIIYVWVAFLDIRAWCSFGIVFLASIVWKAHLEYLPVANLPVIYWFQCSAIFLGRGRGWCPEMGNNARSIY